MEIAFSRDLENKLNRMASLCGRDSAGLVVEAVERLLDYDAWYLTEVDKGLSQIEGGHTLSHVEVGAQLRKYISGNLSRI
jgi:predicted transcriptional regulator